MKLSELLGTEITTLMGCDIISKYKIKFDYNNNSAVFSTKKIDMEGTEISITLHMGIPIIELIIEKRTLKFYLDTGAKLSYLRDEVTDKFENAGVIEDFHPFMERFQTNTFDIITTINDINFNVKYGNLPHILEQAFLNGEIDGIIGQDFFNNFKVMLDIENKKLKYSSS